MGREGGRRQTSNGPSQGTGDGKPRRAAQRGGAGQDRGKEIKRKNRRNDKGDGMIEP